MRHVLGIVCHRSQAAQAFSWRAQLLVTIMISVLWIRVLTVRDVKLGLLKARRRVVCHPKQRTSMKQSCSVMRSTCAELGMYLWRYKALHARGSYCPIIATCRFRFAKAVIRFWIPRARWSQNFHLPTFQTLTSLLILASLSVAGSSTQKIRSEIYVYCYSTAARLRRCSCCGQCWHVLRTVQI